MTILHNDGYCPSCELEGAQSEMFANTDDFFECPNCALQVSAACSGIATILRWRGRGGIKSKNPYHSATRTLRGYVLSRGRKRGNKGAIHIRSDGSSFYSIDELRIFLTTEIKDSEEDIPEERATDAPFLEDTQGRIVPRREALARHLLNAFLEAKGERDEQQVTADELNAIKTACYRRLEHLPVNSEERAYFSERIHTASDCTSLGINLFCDAL